MTQQIQNMNGQLASYSHIQLPVEAELGRRLLTVREILSLSPGSLITLPIPVGSRVTVYAGGTSFCIGEMMRRGNASAVRISSFFDPQGRS